MLIRYLERIFNPSCYTGIHEIQKTYRDKLLIRIPYKLNIVTRYSIHIQDRFTKRFILPKYAETYVAFMGPAFKSCNIRLTFT